ncbi:thiol-disulfide isomerase [Halopseudomonas nanhaiensis]|uniref:DUF6436 domain-containing protein n=1 Tax=Halopseudomonas nanhaiensis TaxID=2830842 RepID=UPI001CBBA144|nr:DUF6436 domain-containing protein [Halopseudomonas nanhaiensis]UAW98601.1 thiol-disulfide isomerase [Halopseudomonas nanhaiensis]
MKTTSGTIWRAGLTALLLVVWLAGLVWAFWWYEGRYVRPFDRPAFFNGVAVAPPFAVGQVQVVHVWQPGCPCNAGHEQYIAEMTERFTALGVQFAVAGAENEEKGGSPFKNLPYWPIPEAWADWPGTPSIAIWDATGRLAYVGPYSDGVHCNSQSSFVEPVIRTLLSGRSVNITSQDTVSCLCELR